MGQSTGLSKVLNQKEVFSVVSKLRVAQRIYAICEARQGRVSQSLGFSTIAKRGVPIEPKVPSRVVPANSNVMGAPKLQKRIRGPPAVLSAWPTRQKVEALVNV